MRGIAARLQLNAAHIPSFAYRMCNDDENEYIKIKIYRLRYSF